MFSVDIFLHKSDLNLLFRQYLKGAQFHGRENAKQKVIVGRKKSIKFLFNQYLKQFFKSIQLKSPELHPESENNLYVNSTFEAEKSTWAVEGTKVDEQRFSI